MKNLLKLPTWADKSHVIAFVEIPRGSICKLDFDPKLNALEERELAFLGWRGPEHATNTIKRLSK